MSKPQHVVPRGNSWAVHGAGNSRDTSVHSKQSAAIDVARSIAVNQKTEVVIHGRDGRIREKTVTATIRIRPADNGDAPEPLAVRPADEPPVRRLIYVSSGSGANQGVAS